MWVLEQIGACLKDVHGAQDWGPSLLEGPSCGNPFSLELCGQARELGWAELVERPRWNKGLKRGKQEGRLARSQGNEGSGECGLNTGRPAT